MGINLFRYHESPIYKREHPFIIIKILVACIIKGYIYKISYPLPIIDMILTYGLKDLFDRHFIPLSRYG